ncbi:hypothetical protein CEXT_87311 [Caerostris extrusa]|uniref:Uncharacterized protein n=1 Tax=Caerostris extrusa TaxID=172846 RepID=A0AAV4WJG6_CAEEX|nr:hypothetical protein CEXT_87311 [Caerostris extrusa]
MDTSSYYASEIQRISIPFHVLLIATMELALLLYTVGKLWKYSLSNHHIMEYMFFKVRPGPRDIVEVPLVWLSEPRSELILAFLESHHSSFTDNY